MEKDTPMMFDVKGHPLAEQLCTGLQACEGKFATRKFPDGESYLQIESDVVDRHCIILCELSDPDLKFLPLCFLASTLKELGACYVGLVAPYLSYMRQDRRFLPGEAVTSRIFAALLSQQVDWMVTVDPHLHRYHSLDEIYAIPTQVVQGAPALARWLAEERDVFLVGPDSESEQWVSDIAKISNHSFVIGEKIRSGDRQVSVQLPDLSKLNDLTAIIIDDVVSSGQTIVECTRSLNNAGIKKIKCASVHGIFADGADELLLESGVDSLVTTNTIPHASNAIDITDLLVSPIAELMRNTTGNPQP